MVVLDGGVADGGGSSDEAAGLSAFVRQLWGCLRMVVDRVLFGGGWGLQQQQRLTEIGGDFTVVDG